MADQEFLASFAVEIDDAGVARLQTVLEENRELADRLAAAFGAASEAIRTFAEDPGLLPDFSGRGIVTEGWTGFGGLSVGLDLTQAFSDYEAFAANASGIVSAARTALSSVKSLFSETLLIRVKTEKTGGDEGDTTTYKMSSGGRFSRPTDVQVAEDGDAEYIIPVKKEEQALPLIRQMLGELPPEARESVALPEEPLELRESAALPEGTAEAGPETRVRTVLEDRPVPSVRQALESPSAALPFPSAAGGREPAGIMDMASLLTGLSGLLSASLQETAAPVTQNVSRNVSAPVNIQVHSSGTGAEQVGQKIYDTAERYLLRTLRREAAM